MRLTAVRNRKLTTTLVVASSLVALASCSDSSEDASPPKSSRTQTAKSPSPSATADSEDAEVIAAYKSSWAAQSEAYKKASSDGTDLRKNTTLRALADIESDLSAMRKAGQVTTGRPAIDPKITKVSEGDITKATVSDCVDTTNWTLIDKASKKKVPLPSQRLAKYVSTATLEKWGTKWMVTQLTAQNQAC
ncbi:hypothetical protein [Streptomyces sp. NPDC053726]|uniref:hypothetical protein n=1 Tax=Streptomyces sp. NPDC053726 TaxID=3365713 RepID=UPI0037D38CB2